MEENEVESFYKKILDEPRKRAHPNEELRWMNFNRVDTEGFEKGIALFNRWLGIIHDAMFEHKSLRIEIIYNAEAEKAEMYVYIPKHDGTDNVQESPND